MGGKVLDYEAKTIRGTVSILKKLGIPAQAIRIQIQEQYNLSQEESEKYL